MTDASPDVGPPYKSFGEIGKLRVDPPSVSAEKPEILGPMQTMVVRIGCVIAIIASVAVILYIRGAIPTLNSILEVVLSIVIGIAARILIDLSSTQAYF